MASLAALSGCSSTRAIERRYPPLGQFVAAGPERVHAVDEGPRDTPEAGATRAPVLLIHGASTNLRDLHPVLTGPLSARRRVVAMDRPGHGYASRHGEGLETPAGQADVLAAAAETLALERPVVVGHSYGGAVALAYALRHPDRVAGLILLAGASHPWPGGTSWYNQLAATPGLGHFFSWTLVPLVAPRLLPGAIADVFAPAPVTPGYLDATGVELSLRPETFRDNARDLVALNAALEAQRPGYARLTLPILVLHGVPDRVVGLQVHARQLAREARDVTLVELSDAGHALHHSHTARVVAEIERFLDRVDGHAAAPVPAHPVEGPEQGEPRVGDAPAAPSL